MVFFFRKSDNLLCDSSVRQPLEMYCLHLLVIASIASPLAMLFCPQQGEILTKAFFVVVCCLATVLIRRAGKLLKIF